MASAAREQRREQRNRQREAWERHERDRRLAAEFAEEDRVAAEEREQEAERRQLELARRDAEVRARAYRVRQELAKAEHDADDLDTDVLMLAQKLAEGRATIQDVLGVRERREQKRAELEVWQAAAVAIGGDPAILGRR